MTAEVVVMNKHAIAMAADSAVTIGSKKIYNSANKLFALSKCEPVGIMVYNNAEIMGLPVETVVKVYREELGSRSFNFLDEYADDFFAFIQGNQDMFPEEDREAHFLNVVRSGLSEIQRDLQRHLSALKSSGVKVSDALARKEAGKLFDAELVYLESMRFAPGMSQASVELLAKAFAPHVDDLEKMVCGDRIRLNLRRKARLAQVAANLIAREIAGELHTGVVFGGFGHKEYQPRMRSFQYVGAWLGQERKDPFAHIDIGRENWDAYVMPFAQRDVADSFLRGRAPDVVDAAVQAVKKKILSFSNGLDENDPAIPSIESLADSVSEHLREKIEEYSRHAHFFKIIQTVASAPKEELATMAEALVNLTSLKRRVTDARETVGGPIDVAIISKGDGFVWSTRKHYFDPSLNHQFFRNYYRGIDASRNDLPNNG